jgi:enediyne biosynthesis protein E5
VSTVSATEQQAERKAAVPPRHDPKVVTALKRFAISISIFNILGYTVLGFEQPWLWPILAVGTAYALDLGLEFLGARAEGRPVRFLGGGPRGVIEFLFPAHITALAVNMLTYPNDQLLVMLFGVTVGVGAKWVLRAPVRGRMRHYMNPSNLGIAVILLVFPWASIAPPYHFTENVHGPIDWLIPAIIIATGTLLNAKLTGRMWLIAGWLSFFALQAVVRGWLFDTAILGALGMMTGVAFVLYTNYMVTDPGTTPSRPVSQFAFGAGVALTYGALTAAHIAYGLFFATALVCLARGAFLWSLYIVDKARVQFLADQEAQREAQPEAATAGTDGTPQLGSVPEPATPSRVAA